MGEEHAGVAPMLGAHAVGALEPEEAAVVEAHLATCAACRAEAERLARAAAWLGTTTQEASPPERLRDAVLAAVRGPAAVPVDPPGREEPAAAALAEATAELDELLGGLTDEQWRRPVIHGWDAGELLRHLDDAGSRPAARPSSASDVLLRRAFETWIHADDLRTALGRPPSPPAPDRLHAVVTLGIRLLTAADPELGVERPGRAVALRLEGPGGGTWTVPPGGAEPVAATVTVPAVEFFYLMGNRRDPGTVATAVTGDRVLAGALLRAATTLGCD